MGGHDWESEVDSVIELIIVGIVCMLGFGVLMTMILTFNARVNEFERYDKVAADVMYDTVVNSTYNFTPYQAYMMGYGIDEWSPEGTSIKWFNNSHDFIEIDLSKFKRDLQARNNMISGALGTNPSVFSVLENMRRTSTRDMETFYRGYDGNIMLRLNWTDTHNSSYDTYLEDGATVWERGKRDYEWVIEKPN